MQGGYELDELDGAIFGGELKRQLAGQRCQEGNCRGELRWTSPQQTLQLGQAVTLTGTCTKCGRQYEMEIRL